MKLGVHWEFPSEIMIFWIFRYLLKTKFDTLSKRSNKGQIGKKKINEIIEKNRKIFINIIQTTQILQTKMIFTNWNTEIIKIKENFNRTEQPSYISYSIPIRFIYVEKSQTFPFHTLNPYLSKKQSPLPPQNCEAIIWYVYLANIALYRVSV